MLLLGFFQLPVKRLCTQLERPELLLQPPYVRLTVKELLLEL